MKQILLTIAGIFCVFSAFSGPHTVQPGESYSDIAKLYHINLDELKAENVDTSAITGLTINVPCKHLLYDLGDSHLFRKFSFGWNADKSKGEKAYSKASNKQSKLSSVKFEKREKEEQEIVQLYESAISYNNENALYEMGKYLIHGKFYDYKGYPDFSLSANQYLDEFRKGVEYLQIAAIVSNNNDALIELALACAYENSPIYNPYMCLGILEYAYQSLHLPVNDLICYMYENGYGVQKDYLLAYVYCSPLNLTQKGADTHRERLLSKIEALPADLKSAKYGVGLDAETLMAQASMFYSDDGVMRPEGLFWMHRAAHGGNAKANWIMAAILQNKKFESGAAGSNVDEQVICFARKAADVGEEEAKEFIAAYDKQQLEIQRERERRERARQEQRLRAQEEKRAKRAAFWNSVLQIGVQVAQTALVAASQHHNARAAAASKPNFGQMTDAEFSAYTTRALTQIRDYTINKTIADWNGTPMKPVDMSGVWLGDDTSVGSPLWQWNMQQEINRFDTQYARAQCERIAFLRRQTAEIEQQLITNPLQPIAGFWNANGEWVSRETVAALHDDNKENTSSLRQNGFEEIRQKNRDYYQQRYGDKDCYLCHHSGVCQTIA